MVGNQPILILGESHFSIYFGWLPHLIRWGFPALVVGELVVTCDSSPEGVWLGHPQMRDPQHGCFLLGIPMEMSENVLATPITKNILGI